MSKILYYSRGIVSDWLLYLAMVVAPHGDGVKIAQFIKEYMGKQYE